MQLGARVRAFAAFVRRRSFVGAAEELRISQPAVSQHIADLERDLGAKLIERRSRKLTDAGELLARHVLRAEALLTKGGDFIRAQRRAEIGDLSIVASGTPGTYLLPGVVADFKKRYPGGHIDFRVDTAKNAVDAVRSHAAEIGVVGAFVSAPEIEVEPLIEDEIILVGSPKLKRRGLSRDDIERLTWITREQGSGTSALAGSAIGDLGITPDNHLALPSWEAIKIAVRLGHGIAALSRLAVTEELKAGSLVRLPIFPTKVRRMFSIIRVREAALTPAAEHFLAMLRTHCASEV
jgi:DNA-binding transcriptional LysR family regulator